MRAPDSLRPYADFLIWRTEAPRTPGAKMVKVPMHFDGVTRHSTANPAPPLTADQAEQWLAYLRATGVGHDRPQEPGYVGMGFRPSPRNGLVCLDLDDQLDSPLVGRMNGAGYEISINGSGLHVWGMHRESERIGRRGQVSTPLGKMELYGDGQFIALGTWLSGSAQSDCTEEFDQIVAEFFPAPSIRASAVTAPDWESKSPDQRAAAVADLRSALLHYDPDNRDEWIAAGQALVCLGDLGQQLWAEWSATSTRFPGGADLDKWDTFTGERSDYRAIYARAASRGWVNPARGAAAADVFTGMAQPAELAPPPTGVVLSFTAAAAGAIPATLANVEAALMSAEGGVNIAFDEFKGVVCLGQPGAWRPLTDIDYGMLRMAFERRGFKPVPAEIMKTSVEIVANQRRFDSAIEWASSLVWDGTPRVATSMAYYFGTEDNPYTRAVGAYLWTALAGRALDPGCKADMALILISQQQGLSKTSIIEAIAPTTDSFVEISLEHRDDDLSRKMRGKLVGEIAEMRGLQGRDNEAIKAWVSRRTEEWTPKYKEFAVQFPRRLVLIGTANDEGLLSDPTGERRWLPMTTNGARLAELRRDRDQLWAEGVAIWRASGIAWQDAERLARDQHGKFAVSDPWEEIVLNWLWTPPVPAIGDPPNPPMPGSVPIALVDVLRRALGLTPDRMDRKAELRAARILRKFGYFGKDVWIEGKTRKRWIM